jgi:hypothetical protein
MRKVLRQARMGAARSFMGKIRGIAFAYSIDDGIPLVLQEKILIRPQVTD